MSVIGFYLDDVTSRAVALGPSVADLWTQLREQAAADAQARLEDLDVRKAADDA